MNLQNNVPKNKTKNFVHNSKLKASNPTSLSSLNNDTRLENKRRKYSKSHNIKSELTVVNSHKTDDFSGKKSKLTSEIWFDDIPEDLIAASMQDQSASSKSLVKASSFNGPTKHIAIDCEFVGVGYEGKENALARVSIVNQFGHVLLDTFVRPKERVVDYRTQYSGVRPHDLRQGGSARSFNSVHNEVAKLCKGRILIGHSIGNDLKVLMISHPRRDIRDTSRYRPFRDLFSGRTPSLRNLTERVLGVKVQVGEHNSIEDARAAMRLYTSVKRVWEAKKKRPSTCNRFNKATNQTSGSLNSLCSLQSPTVSKLDIKSEFESGFEDLNKNEVDKPEISKKINRSKPWDNTRGRLCSKKRAKFLNKRRKSSHKKFQTKLN